MKVNVKRAQFEKKVSHLRDQKNLMVSFAIAAGCGVCRGMRNFGKLRLNRLVRGTYDEISEHYAHYGGDPAVLMDYENIITLYYGMRNQIRALNVPVDDLEAEFVFSPEFPTWHSRYEREKRKVRYEELGSLEKIVRVFWYSMILHLWHTYGWGEVRLRKFYRSVQAVYNTTMGFYLECRDERDAQVWDVLNGQMDAIHRLGVEF